MCVFKEFSSQAALSLGKREVEVRSRWSEAAKVCAEFASNCARSGRFILCAVALSFPLAGCVTTASVPSSPFLTAVARLSPFQANANANGAATDLLASARNANAAASEDIATGSVSPVTAVPSSGPQSEGQNGSVIPAGNAPIEPAVDRSGVYPQIASASPKMVEVFAAAKPSAPPPGRDVTSSLGVRAERKGVSLSNAIAAAVLNHPLMGAQAAKVTGSLADVRTAQGATKPQLQVYAGSGGSYLGSYSNYSTQFGSVEIPGGSRSDAGFTLRQLVYDFGAAKADIARSKSLVNAERLRLADQAEDIALRTANAYLNLLEQAELIALIDKVVVDDNSFANLVNQSERQGNGTLADVNRIKSKVIEVEALRTDIKTSYSTAQDEFFRLTKLDSSKVGRPASISSQVPRSLEAALAIAKQNNPSLLALNANGVSIDQQLASQKAQQLPRVDLQGDGLVKHYVGASATASPGVVDTRLMLMVSYKLLDGGVMASQADRILEDKKVNEFRAVDEKESIELNLKRFYQALSANRTKEDAAIRGTSTALKANSLYLEQFKAGKRTVFEVLDSRMVVFTMQKNAVSSRYEQLRAAYGILRNMGRLVETAIRV
jgi:adhesin transport system outer membrane protein